MNKYIIRTSDRKAFKDCRQAWDFGSKIRQDLEPVKRNLNFDFGTAIHAGAQAFHDPRTWHDDNVKRASALVEFLDSWRTFKEFHSELWDEMADLGLDMLRDYAKRDFPYEPIYTEKEFEVAIPVSIQQAIRINGLRYGTDFGVLNGCLYYRDIQDGLTPVLYQGRIDALVKDQDGLYWVVDHKTCGKFDSIDHLEMDPQLKSYCWALQEVLGIPIHGAIYDELLKSVPQEPKQLKDGSFSQDKRQNTTVELYQQTLDKNGQSVVGYEGFLAYLTENPRQYFRRTFTHYSQKELQIEGERIVLEAIDMLNDPHIYPAPDKFKCGWCPFRAPCLVNMEDGDPAFLLTNNYVKRGNA